MLYRKRATDTAFHYPNIIGSLSGGRPVVPNADQRPVAGNFNNSNNMTIIALVAPGSEFRNGDSIVAYVNGEVRGKAKPILNAEIKKLTWFFNIGGEAEQSLLFMLEINGSIIAQSSTLLNYRSNAIIGTLAKPLELHFVKTAGTITVFPNPFNNTANISVDLRGSTVAGSHEIQWSIVDVAGRVVMSSPIQKVSGTGYRTTWNGRNADGTPSIKGVYFIRMTIDGIPQIYKVVRQ
jgi:hypothetical protein